MKHTFWNYLPVGLVAGFVSLHAEATVTTFSNEGTFAATTGASLQHLPNLSAVSSVTSTGGVLSITGASASNLLYSGSSSGFNTADYVGKSDTENFNIAANSTVYAFGLSFYEPAIAGPTGGGQTGCNAECFDTTFTLTLFSGATNLGSYTIKPVDNAFDFYGYWSSSPITGIQIRDITATVDNEFIGRFFTSSTAYVPPTPEPVPLPAAVWLLLSGLGGLGLLRRRNAA